MKVLFVCTGNTCRSPMAEHLFRKMAADAGLADVQARSAGIAVSTSIAFPEEAVAALAKEGVRDVTHRPTPLDANAVDWADEILTMEPFQRDAVVRRFPAAEKKVRLLKAGGIADPFGGSIDEYRLALAEIKKALADFIRNLTH